MNRGHDRLADGERAGLVENHHVRFGEQFEIDAALDQNAVAGRAGDGGDHDERRGEAEFGGRGEDQQGDDFADVVRDEIDAQQEDEDDGDEPRGDFIRELLHRCLEFLRALHQRDDPREHRLLAELVGANVERARFDQRPGKHGAIDALFLRQTFARDRRFVHRALSADHGAIDGNFLAAAHEHDVADFQLGDGHGALLSIGAHERGLRHGTNQSFDRSASAVGVQLRDELGDQDDGHQHGTGDVFAADHGDDCCDGDENLGADFALAKEVEQSSFHQRIQPECNGRVERWQRQEASPVKQREESHHHDAPDFKPAIPRQQGAQGRFVGRIVCWVWIHSFLFGTINGRAVAQAPNRRRIRRLFRDGKSGRARVGRAA